MFRSILTGNTAFLQQIALEMFVFMKRSRSTAAALLLAYHETRFVSLCLFLMDPRKQHVVQTSVLKGHWTTFILSDCYNHFLIYYSKINRHELKIHILCKLNRSTRNLKVLLKVFPSSAGMSVFFDSLRTICLLCIFLNLNSLFCFLKFLKLFN